MVLPTGTSTNWTYVEELSDSSKFFYVYFTDGSMQGRDYLAEQLRQDGAASSLGAALSMADSATLNWGWAYVDEDSEEYAYVYNDPGVEEAQSILIAEVPAND